MPDTIQNGGHVVTNGGFPVLPETYADAIGMLRVAGIQLIGPAVRWMEANDDPGNRHKWLAIHETLNQAGYAIKELTGVDVGAGGGGKGLWGLWWRWLVSELWQLFNAHPQPFYGAEVGITLAVCALADSDRLLKTALLLLFAWLGCNQIEAWFGYNMAPPLLAMMDAVLCIATLRIAWRTHHRVGLTVAALYWVAIGVWLVAIYERTQSLPVWYIATNGVFFVQVLITGVAGGGLAYMAHSRRRRNVGVRRAIPSL